ncbi:hypothetical protein NN561_002823 [Cricetulus griseus]
MAAGGGRAFQRAGCPSTTVGVGRSVAFSSFGAPCMIRAEQGSDTPCLPPVSRSPDEGQGRRAALGLEGGGMRRLEGTRPPHSTASSRHWPGRDCMVRARRRVPPAARRLPCRGLRAPADSGGRWQSSQDAPRSAPPPRSRTLSPTSSELRATAESPPSVYQQTLMKLSILISVTEFKKE